MQTNNAAFAVNTYPYTLTHTALDCARSLAGQGFRALELMLYPGHLWPADMDSAARSRLRSALDALGMRVLTLNMPNIDINIAAAAPDMRRRSLQVLADAVVLAGELGASGVIVGPGKPNPLLPMPAAQLRGHFFSALDHLAPLAQRAGTTLLTENMPFAFLPRVAGLLQALDAYGDPSIGVVFDVANSHFIGEDVAQALRACAARLKIVHVSDTDQRAYSHAPVGAGTLDFAAAARALQACRPLPQTMLEIVCADPDVELRRSADRLRALGWPADGGAWPRAVSVDANV